MSAPSGGASSAPQCACTNISIMQLFHELKQQFPGVPDHVVSSTISSHCHDRLACQSRLECEAKNYITHLYPSSSLSSVKKEGKDILLPQQCPNQLLISKESEKPKLIQVSSICPQKGVCGFIAKLDENDNQNIIRDKHKECDSSSEETYFKSCPSSDVGLTSDTNVGNTEGVVNADSEQECGAIKSIPRAYVKSRKGSNITDEYSNNCTACIADNVSYGILKSDKIKSGLNKKLKGQSKISVSESALPTTDGKNTQTIEATTKLKRPTTLEFSSDPQFSGFSRSAPEAQPETAEESKTQSLSAKVEESASNNEPPKNFCDKSSETRNVKEGYNSSHQEAYPVNVSVNLNCRMDVVPHGNRQQQSQFSEPWRGSPGNFTSVNLTVCTPTSSGPPDSRGQQYQGDPCRGFEGRVQITVSPASGQPPYRVPPSQARHFYSPLPQTMPETPPTSPIDTLLRRQKARLARLQRALAAERGRLASMQREVSVLRAAPTPDVLRPTVLRLRQLCQRLTRHLDRATSAAEGEFYDNIYTGQRMSPPAETGGTWQCHVCTFRNHGLLNKCEECDMPRIILGRTVASGLLSVLPLVHPSPTNPVAPSEEDQSTVSPDRVHVS